MADYQPAAQGGPEKGLECPACAFHHFLVDYNRHQPGHIERRRQFRHCGRRITTWESEVGRG